MEFTRMGEHTVRCLMTEDEITDMGYTVEEIMSNGSKTQEFMSKIFAMARRQYQINFDTAGIKTVRADFLPDHKLCLTFSEHSGDNMMEQLKQAIREMFGDKEEMPPALQELMEDEPQQQEASEKEVPLPAAPENPDSEDVLFKFQDLDTVLRFAGLAAGRRIPDSILYKGKEHYYLQMKGIGAHHTQQGAILLILDEYGRNVPQPELKLAYLKEHGRILIRERAIEQLLEIQKP